MLWASYLSKQAVAQDALSDALSSVRSALSAPPDLAMLFLSTHHEASAKELVKALCEAWPGVQLLGCCATGVIGDEQEIEGEPALSLMVGHLPGVGVEPMRLTELPQSDDPRVWREVLGLSRHDVRALLMVAPPGQGDQAYLLRGLDLAYPEAVKLGGVPGLVDGAESTGLLLGDQVYTEGMVGIALCGDVIVETVVAQACRPVGEPMIVTSCRDNIVFNLDRGRPDHMIRKLHSGLDPRDRELFRDSLFIGVEMADKVGEYRRGDFLIRSIVGFDPDRGAMAVDSLVEPFQVIQFQIRDRLTALEDLRDHLGAKTSGGRAEPEALLMWSCKGRGERLYSEPDHDIRLLREFFPVTPVAGMFCDGEIGPVAGRTFLHNYTCVLALIRPA